MYSYNSILIKLWPTLSFLNCPSLSFTSAERNITDIWMETKQGALFVSNINDADHMIQIQNESTFVSWKNFVKSASTFLEDVQNMWCTSKLAKGKYLYLPQKPLIKSLNIHGCKTTFSFVVYKGKLVLPKNCDVRFEKLNPENWEIYLCS